MNPIKISKKQAWPIVSQVFPDYGGRKFRVEFVNEVTFYDTNWGGGTRNQYAFMNRKGQTAHLYVPAPWVNVAEGKSVQLPADVLVIEHTIFCGQDMGIRIYANPVNAPKWIEA